jgi:glutaredoxin
LKAWAESLGGITYPLMSDFWPHGDIAKKYGVLRNKEGKSERAIFIIDPEGVIKYIDVHDIDDQPKNEVLFAELAKLNPSAAVKMILTEPEVKPDELPHGGVVMYCTSWCPGCRTARTWFNNHNIPFIEVDIGKDRRAAAQVREWANGYETTPAFDIDGTIIVEWDERKIKEALKIN